MTSPNPTFVRADNAADSPPQLPPISIVIGHVRIGTVYTWSGARSALRQDIRDSYPVMGTDRVLSMRAYELDRVGDNPSGTSGARMIMTSGRSAWADSVRYAQEGEHGLTAGDLCIVHDHPNGRHRIGWTVDVKAVIIAITPYHKVTVRITGESTQFDRNQTVTVPSSFIRPRPKRGH